jgi:hypothetical protein
LRVSLTSYKGVFQAATLPAPMDVRQQIPSAVRALLGRVYYRAIFFAPREEISQPVSGFETGFLATKTRFRSQKPGCQTPAIVFAALPRWVLGG